jgi:hypothetical protein
MVIGACMWSGVETETASSESPIEASISRQSVKRAAFGNFSPAAFRRPMSMSQIAAISTFAWPAICATSVDPMPPTPTEPTRSFWSERADAKVGRQARAAADAARVVWTKWRRSMGLDMGLIRIRGMGRRINRPRSPTGKSIGFSETARQRSLFPRPRVRPGSRNGHRASSRPAAFPLPSARSASRHLWPSSGRTRPGTSLEGSRPRSIPLA